MLASFLEQAVIFLLDQSRNGFQHAFMGESSNDFELLLRLFPSADVSVVFCIHVFIVPVRVQFGKQKEGLFFEHVATRLPTDSITVVMLLYNPLLNLVDIVRIGNPDPFEGVQATRRTGPGDL